MFPQIDTELLQKLAKDPNALMAALHEFQSATLAAAHEIAENNVAAFQDLAAKATASPQDAAVAQPVILKETYDKNMDVLKTLWSSLSANVAPPAKPATAKK